MPPRNDRSRSSYGAFTTRRRELERSRARRDAREAERDGAGDGPRLADVPPDGSPHAEGPGRLARGA